MDIADPASVDAALAALEALGGDQRQRLRAHRRRREPTRERCMRENAIGPQVLARACAAAAIALVTFSSDLVFDGRERPALRRERRRQRRSTSTAAARPRPRRAVLRAASRRAGRVAPAPSSAPGTSTTSSRRRCDALDARRALRGRRRRARLADLRARPGGRLPRPARSTASRGIWHLANAGDVSWAEFAAAGRRLRDHWRRFTAPEPRPLAGRSAPPGRPTQCWAASAAG